MSEIHHDEYFQRYKALQALLEQAYVDIYALQEIERYNESVKEGNRVLLKSSYNVLGHICELLKADLGLTIWKIHSDGNGKANTINKLREFINHNYLDLIHANEIPKMFLPKSLRTTEKKLSQLRNTFLAHNDAEKSHASVQLPDMIAIVDELRNMLNALCFSAIDSRVQQTIDKTLLAMQFNVSFGFGLMINRSTFPINTGKSEE